MGQNRSNDTTVKGDRKVIGAYDEHDQARRAAQRARDATGNETRLRPPTKDDETASLRAETREERKPPGEMAAERGSLVVAETSDRAAAARAAEAMSEDSIRVDVVDGEGDPVRDEVPEEDAEPPGRAG